MLSPFGGFQLAHVFAGFFHRHHVEAFVRLAGHAFAFFPEGAEVGFQFAVHADVVHGIVAFVGHRIDFADAQAPCQIADAVEDQIFGPVSKKRLGHPFDGITAVGRALQGADPDGVPGFFPVRPEPEHDLVKDFFSPGQNQGQAAFLILSRMEI